MREKTKCTRWFHYAIEDARAAQAELDELAGRGWELEDVGFFTATFRRAERPRPCWVEPARWTSIRRRDEDARADYLALCGEAGWELIGEDGGLFYFRAKEGADPAPIQTDRTVEWEAVWKKALRDQISSLAWVAAYWVVWAAVGFWKDRPRVWELFLSNWLMAAQLLILLWLGLELFLLVRVLRYRARCRRAAAEGESFPVPRRGGARLRGAWPLVCGALFAAALAVVLLAAGEGETRYLDGYSAYTRESRSVLGDYFEYRRFDGAEGDLWVERADCRAGWLAGWICGDFRAAEESEKRVGREFHLHGAAIPQEAELGFDRAWTYSIREYQGLILRDGDQTARIEGSKRDLTSAETLAAIRAWLAEPPGRQTET